MKIPVYAYYFPNWHVTPQNEVWHGKGWTEWQCVKYATPRFSGHVQPKVPLWGYEDESNPAVMAKKIACAKKYGINGFIFDWYWYPEVGPYRIDCLNKGFLGAENSQAMQFAVMWCNHKPIAAHPSPYFLRNQDLIPRSMTEEAFRELTQYCIDHYFRLEHYIKINGNPYFCIYSLAEFVAEAGEEGAKRLIEDFRARARKAGVGAITLGTVPPVSGVFDLTEAAPQVQYGALCKELGIEIISPHAWFKYHGENVTYEYADFIQPTVDRMKFLQETWNVPLCPSVMIGEDNSPRTVQSEIFDVTRGYPYSPIAVNNTPQIVGRAVSDMLRMMEKGVFSKEFLVIESWNEWTEGSYLEPDEENGYRMLEAIYNARRPYEE